jgi:hypothetical protein
MRLMLDFPRYLRRICQGHSLADSQASIELEIAEAFCLPAEAVAPKASHAPKKTAKVEE